jgi:L-histidine N-alpha-methyltransferase
MNNQGTSVGTGLEPHMSDFLENETSQEIIDLILSGLTATPKYISSRFFYDDHGSGLFEKITELPEYYLTRTEKSILEKEAVGIVDRFDGGQLIELGSGDCSKISLVLNAVSSEKMKHLHYYPVDVSRWAIVKSFQILIRRFPGIRIHGILADFLKYLKFFPVDKPRLICFFGSTLGNFESGVSKQFLLNVASLMDPGDHFLLGIDMVKDHYVLEKAYNDSQGVTASFNKNILNVVNDRAETDFNPEQFEHMAFYNTLDKRVEMHLEALDDMTITSPYFESGIMMRKGETIHTENSHKFSRADISEIAAFTGFRIEQVFTDDKDWFSLVHYIKP